MIYDDSGQAQEACREWQKILRLQDWDITVDILRDRDMKLGSGQAEVHWKAVNRSAIVHLLDPTDYQNNYFEQDHERSLVHELLHLHMVMFATETDTPEDTAQEQAVDAIAKALVTLKRRE